MGIPTIFHDLNRFSRYCLITGIACQGMSLAFTFLPWTRYLGDSYADFREFQPLKPLYNGNVGKLNLAITAILLFILFLVGGSKKRLRLCALLAVLWNVIFTYLLIDLQQKLEVFKEYGLTLNLVAAIGAILAYFGLIISLSLEMIRG